MFGLLIVLYDLVVGIVNPSLHKTFARPFILSFFTLFHPVFALNIQQSPFLLSQ